MRQGARRFFSIFGGGFMTTRSVPDAGFLIGSTHAICQDYAVAGERNGHSFAILSDGCSGSPHTDIGARLLATSAVKIVADRQRWKPDYRRWKPTDILDSARETLPRLDLPGACLDATLLILEEYDMYFLATILGDGVLVAREAASGDLRYIRLEYPGGYPAYLSHALSVDSIATYPSEDAWLVEVEDGKISADGSVTSSRTIFPVDARFIRTGLTYAFAYEGYDMVAALSDGSGSFVQQIATESSLVNEPVPLTEVLSRIVAFKSTAPCYAQRRLLRFRTECQKLRQLHLDDLSVAALLLRK
jgi:hypothetical protein